MRLLVVGMMAAALGLVPAYSAEQEASAVFDKAKMETYVRHLLLWGSQIEITISDPVPSEIDGFMEVRVKGTAGAASQEKTFYVSEDGQQLLQATAYDLDKNPFHKVNDLLSVEEAPSFGTAGAPVRLVLFSDFECAYCRLEAEELRKNLLETYPTEVRLYYKDYPLESIHPWSRAGAIAGRCFYQQSEESFWPFHDWIYAHQSEITEENLQEKVLEFGGTQDSIDTLRLSACMTNRSTEDEVDRSVANGRALQINSTPTLFVNGRGFNSRLPWETLKQIIDIELDYQETANNAGDTDCCSIQLPVPASQ